MPAIVQRRRTTSVARGLVLGLLVVGSVFPVFWMASTAFKPFDEIYRFPPNLFPTHPTLTQFRGLFGVTSSFGRLVVNSLVVSSVTTAITMLLSAGAGYGLAKGRFRGRVLLLRSTLIAYVFPPILLVVPLFGMLAGVRLANTIAGLVVVSQVVTIPFAVWLLTSYFASVPQELTEAARIDGASNIRAFWSIALPITTPGLATVAIFTFINTWNEFLFAFVIGGSGDDRTLSVGLAAVLRGAEGAEYGVLMAGSSIAIAPILVLFIFAQRHIVAGLSAGSVKG